MNLIITDYAYRSTPAYLVQGVGGHRVPRNAVAGGNGSFIVSNPAEIMVDVRNVDTGECRTVDMYRHFKRMLEGNRLTERRAEKIIQYYRRQQSFWADGWDDWEEIPNIDSVIR